MKPPFTSAILQFCLLCFLSILTARIAYSQTYSGVLPCADCEGIATIITLNKAQRSYRMQEQYLGKNEAPVRTDGTYKIINGIYVFYHNQTVKGIYLVKEKEMIMLDKQWRRMEGELAQKYILQRTAVMTINAAWQKKKTEGIDFVGFGTEPFWNLDIDAPRNVRLQTADLTIDVEFPYSDYKEENGQMIYRLKVGNESLEITIAPQYCSDLMSDYLYEYKVTLVYNGRTFTGCGAKIGDLPKPSPLPGKWELVFLSGERKVLNDTFPQQMPWLKLESTEKKFSAFTGCNNMNGNYYTHWDTLLFKKPIAVTLRACAGTGEARFLQMFKQVTRYRMEEEQLVLLKGNAVLMRFKKWNEQHGGEYLPT